MRVHHLWRLRLGQQPHAEHRDALAIGPVACTDAAAVAFHQALAEPQAQAVAVILGREEGAEQAFSHAGRQARARVRPMLEVVDSATVAKKVTECKLLPTAKQRQGGSAVQPQYLLRDHVQLHFAGAAFDRVRLRA